MNKIEFFIPGEPVAKGRPKGRIQKKKDGQKEKKFNQAGLQLINNLTKGTGDTK